MSDEKQEQPRMFTHRAFDRHPAVSRARAGYFKAVIMNALLITATIWGVLAIYWGALWRPYYGVHNLNAWIVDFDGGAMGATVREALMNATRDGGKMSMTWYEVPASMFPNGEADLPGRIVGEDAWVAVAISAGATSRLNAAIAARDSTYNGSSAVTAYAAESRNENSYRDFVLPQTQTALTTASGAFAMQNAMTLGPDAGALLAAAPTTVLMPLNYTIANVRPFDIQVATAVDFVGLIYLLILAFMSVLASYQARTMVTGLENMLSFPQLMLLRLALPFLVYFWLSLAFALLSKFFLVPFNRQFGDGGFVLYWMLLWCGMLALGLAVEALIPLLTLRFISFFLVLWIIVNVSVSYYPIEILPTIYRYGYAMPFYNVSRAVRTILFRTRNQVGLNFGVLLAWIAVSLVSMPLIQFFVWRKARRAHEAEERGRRDSEATAR